MIARAFTQWQEAGKEIITVLGQQQLGRRPECTKGNQELAINVACPLQASEKAKKVSIGVL